MGVLFRDTPDGARWLETGERILTREIEAQIYPDGVDHEASTPYHRLVLELFLTGFLLLEKAGRAVPQRRRGSASSGCSISWRRTRSRTVWRRSSAMPTMAGSRNSARRI